MPFACKLVVSYFLLKDCNFTKLLAYYDAFYSH